MATLGFIGLGAMGGRMARRLLDAGHPVVGFNRTQAKAAALVRAGLELAPTPRQVAEAAEVVFSMVSDTEALEAVAHGDDGVLAGLRRGATWVEMGLRPPPWTEGAALCITNCCYR